LKIFQLACRNFQFLRKIFDYNRLIAEIFRNFRKFSLQFAWADYKKREAHFKNLLPNKWKIMQKQQHFYIKTEFFTGND